jgi:hypothetical protein
MFSSKSSSMESEFHYIYRKSVPPALEREIVKCIFAEYLSAHASVNSKFSRYTAHDLYPYERRAFIEDKLIKIARQHPNVGAIEKPNKNGGNYHVEISCGQVILTVNAVNHPEQIVRYADFRKTLASNGQLEFQFEDIEEEASDNSNLYAIILHGPSTNKTPNFIDIVFPDKDCKKYRDRVNLLHKHSDIYEDHKVAIEEVEPVQIKIKKDIGEENLSGEKT